VHSGLQQLGCRQLCLASTTGTSNNLALTWMQRGFTLGLKASIKDVLDAVFVF
jgi:hypothetical protein